MTSPNNETEVVVNLSEQLNRIEGKLDQVLGVFSMLGALTQGSGGGIVGKGIRSAIPPEIAQALLASGQ